MKSNKANIAFAVLSSSAAFLSHGSVVTANGGMDLQIPVSEASQIGFQLSSDDAISARGLVLRLHYDSAVFSSFDIASVLEQSHLVTIASQTDSNDHDNDSNTDRFVLASWSDTSATWPGTAVSDLTTVQVVLSDDFAGGSTINLTAKTYTDLQPELTSLTFFTDADNDEIRDDFELENGMDPRDRSDAAMDFDNDGLTNLQEFLLGTLVNDADTDNDGMPDGYEAGIEGLSPTDDSDADTDLDGDGRSNLQEYRDGTDPLDSSDFKPAVAFDYDGDQVADVAVRRASNFFQYILNSENESISRVEFGRNMNDIPVSGDFDGDGKIDVAVRRPSNSTWYIRNSSDGEIQRLQFGLQAGDIPVPADYDGDGITDIAVRRPSNSHFYIRNSSDGETQRIVFGLQSTDIPVPADYDGDGKVDVAVRRPSNKIWYIKQSSDGEIRRVTFGLQEADIPVPADYDGDGKADVAFRRPSNQTWYILRSSDGETQRVTFGRQSTDIPVAADYDGDGKVDIAVRRPSNFTQYILNSSDGNIQRVVFGRNQSDIPLAAPVSVRMNMVNGDNPLTISGVSDTFIEEYPEIDILMDYEFDVKIDIGPGIE